jgi:hypothetical protein
MTYAQAFWFVFIGGVVYLGLCVLFMVGWSKLMSYNKRCDPVAREFVRPTRRRKGEHGRHALQGPHKKPRKPND